jgi:hypothetical protein
MKIPKEQQMRDLLAEFTRVRRAILDAAAALPPDRQAQVFLGTWSACELLAHLSGWDETNLAAVSSLQAGQLPEFYVYRDRDWQSYNARLVAQYGRETLDESRRLAAQTYAQLVAALRSLSPSVFFQDFGVRYKGYRVTIARLIESEVTR